MSPFTPPLSHALIDLMDDFQLIFTIDHEHEVDFTAPSMPMLPFEFDFLPTNCFSLLQVLDVIFFSLTLILFFLWTIFETVFLPPFFYYYFLIAFYPFYSIAILSAFFSVFLLMTFFGLSLMLTHEKWRKISLPTIYFEGSRMKRESIHLRMPLNKLKVPWEMCENRGWSLSICSML